MDEKIMSTEITPEDLCLPATIDCVAGREMNIYFYNILRCTNVDDYRFRVRGVSKEVQNLGDRLRIRLSQPQNKGLTFDIMRNGQLLFSKEVMLHCYPDRVQPMRALFIGDSLIEAALSQAELKNMMGEALTLYGTRHNTVENASGVRCEIAHEGRSSWHTNHYKQKSKVEPSKEVMNEFYNPDKDDFDFAYYMEKHPEFADTTDVFLQLGPNDASNVKLADYIANLTNMAKQALAYNPNIRVYVALMAPPVRCGYAWGTRNFSDVEGMKNTFYAYVKAILDDEVLPTICHIVPLYLNLDCTYDFPMTMVPRSARNPEMMRVCNDNVHPSKYGFYKFADVFYNAVVAESCDNKVK